MRLKAIFFNICNFFNIKILQPYSPIDYKLKLKYLGINT